MGQQNTIEEIKPNDVRIRKQTTVRCCQVLSASPKLKTNFHYIRPLQCESQDQNQLDKEDPDKQAMNEAEYWQIQNNADQKMSTIQSSKDIKQLNEIKVKWNTFIKMKKMNYLDDYTLLKEIGRGGFGCVHKVKARYTGIFRAAKRIKKAQLKKSQHEKLFEQMAIMISLDHPNITKLYEVYDYKSYYVLILELCEGGQLFKKIVTKQMTQQSSARVTKQILRTLIYLHKMNIVHRDLKPENMLFQSNSEILKLIDFGIAVKKKPDQILTTRLGTPYYIAPEVLCKKYDEKCDVWSTGVILFMMIAGYPPFRGGNEFEVMQNIIKDPLVLEGAVWDKASPQCRQLVAWMLKKNPQERPNATEAFNHPFISGISEIKSVAKPSLEQQMKILKNLRGFSFKNQLQAVVYTYIVSQLLSNSEKQFLLEIFKELDTNHDGVIQVSQLKMALQAKKSVSQERVKMILRIIDTNSSGQIDYTEFLVAGIDIKDVLTENHFQQAFQYFDIDHSGQITFEEIAFFLEDTKQSEDSIKKIFMEIDENGDGNISKEEFVKLFMKQSHQKLKSKISSTRSIKDKSLDQSILVQSKKNRVNPVLKEEKKKKEPATSNKKQQSGQKKPAKKKAPSKDKSVKKKDVSKEQKKNQIANLIA